MEEKKKTGMHIASLTLGIISIITALFYYISIPTGILAIIFGVKSVKINGSGVAKAGIITGIIGISLVSFIYISMIFIILLSSSIF